MTPGVPTAESIARLIEDALDIEVPSPETDMVDAGLIDSLALMTLITEIEAEMGIELPLDELDVDSFRSPERIAAYVASRAADGKSG